MASITLDMTDFADVSTGKVDASTLLDLTADLDLRFDVVGDPQTSLTLEFTGPVQSLYGLLDRYADDDGHADSLAAHIVE